MRSHTSLNSSLASVNSVAQCCLPMRIGDSFSNVGFESLRVHCALNNLYARRFNFSFPRSNEYFKL
jgi:hypothetical protein